MFYVFIAGGVATGAGEIKSSDERTTFGGFAGAQLDPCYHKVNLHDV